MAHLIDKDALVAEIDKLQLCTMDEHMNYYSAEAQGEYNALSKLEFFIDTLEVKEVDLDNFIKEEFNKYSCVDGYGQLSVSYNMAEFYGMIKRLTKAQKGEKYEKK